MSVFKDTPKDRERYQDLVDICINYRLNQTYQLTAYTEIEVCDKSTDAIEIDSLDLLFLAVLAILIMLMLFSSMYDASINTKHSLAHYENDLSSKSKILIFSTRSNIILQLSFQSKLFSLRSQFCATGCGCCPDLRVQSTSCYVPCKRLDSSRCTT